ncbi:MAG: GGDEF domain-containing protein [Actinobacteria bacterium]|nr:GGDEF domain-containing protein [Actinomycetota bacterium]
MESAQNAHPEDHLPPVGKEAIPPVVTSKDVAMGWILFYMLAFGALVGLTFPWVVADMLEWKPDQEPLFRLACVVAGVSVGGFAYGVARFTLYRANRHLAHLAVFDALTGLANQRYFFQLLRAEISRAGRQDATTTLIIADLDHFKHINDAHGHPVGNAVLAEVGRTILECVRAYDVGCRIGGEEFAVILPDTGLSGAWVVAERIRIAVSTITSQTLPPVTISVGIAVFPEDADTLQELVRKADDAMYAAKDAGRNTTMAWRDSPLRAADMVQRIP